MTTSPPTTQPPTRIQRRRHSLPLADNRAAIDRLSALTTPPRRFRGPILPRSLLRLMRAIREENRTRYPTHCP